MKTNILKLFGAAALGLMSLQAQAQLYTDTVGPLLPGYVQNDDGTFAAVDLGFNVDFFGTSYSSIFLNNNGTASFGAPTAAFSSEPLNSQSAQPMIAPYWTDLDSRGGGATAGIYVSQTAHQMVATWQGMGYFAGNYTGRVTFQLVLNDPNAPRADGEGVIGLFYGAMSSGTDGHNVSVGFGDGLVAINPGEIAFIDGASAAVSSTLNGTHAWFNLDGGTPTTVPAVPEPETYALMALGLGAMAFTSRKRRPAA
jgi:PEP-CTERM motif